MQEVAGSPGMGRALCQAVFVDSLLSEDVRRRGGAAICHLLARSPPLLQRADVMAGLTAFMLSYADQASLAPPWRTRNTRSRVELRARRARGRAPTLRPNRPAASPRARRWRTTPSGCC